MNWMSAIEMRIEHVPLEPRAECLQQASILGPFHFVAEETELIIFHSKAAGLLAESSTCTGDHLCY